MPKKEEISIDMILPKINKISNIDEAVNTARYIIKQGLMINQETTFQEISQIINKKRIDEEIKSKISEICVLFEELEYSRKRITEEKINLLKNKLKEISRLLFQKKEIKKQTLFSIIVKKAKTANETKEKTKKRTKKIKEILKNKIDKKIDKRIDNKTPSINDAEIKKIKKFLEISKKLGIPKSQAKKELIEIGIKKEKIEKVIKNL